MAHAINPIFNAENVQQELNAQIQITQAFDKAQQQVRIELNRKVDAAKAEKGAISDMLKNPDLGEEQRMNLITQGLNAQKEIEQLENMGLVFSAVTGGLSAPTNNIGGIIANSLAPEAANQIGQYFKDHGTEGSATHILAHGVLASAIATLGGNDPMGAALSAMGGELAAPLVADLLYGKPSEELNAEQKSTVSAIASLGGIAVGAGMGGNVNDIAQASLATKNAVDNNWGVVGHYSTMATVLYLAGFSPKDAKAVALAAWGPDTDKRNAMSTDALTPNNNYQETIHLLDNQDDKEKVVATQQKLAEQVRVILLTIKQYENDPARKAAYLTTPSVQNILHSFGDSFAHVDGDGTHYPSGRGHAVDSKTGNDPDNPNIHEDAYKNYVNTLFSVASQVSVIPRVSDSAITNLVNKVTASDEDKQANVLNSAIGSVSSAISSSLVNSPVSDCGYGSDCSKKSIGSQVNPKINSIYGIGK